MLRDEEGVPLAEVHRRLAYWLDGYYDSNQDTIERLYSAFRVATVAVLAEAIAVVAQARAMTYAKPAPVPPPPPDLGNPETRGGGSTRGE